MTRRSCAWFVYWATRHRFVLGHLITPPTTYPLIDDVQVICRRVIYSYFQWKAPTVIAGWFFLLFWRHPRVCTYIEVLLCIIPLCVTDSWCPFLVRMLTAFFFTFTWTGFVQSAAQSIHVILFFIGRSPERWTLSYLAGASLSFDVYDSPPFVAYLFV